MSKYSLADLPYDANKLPRELARHYIPASDEDIQSMLETCGLSSFDQIFDHLPEEIRFTEAPQIKEELEYTEVMDELSRCSELNSISNKSFIGDGLNCAKVMDIVPEVLKLREMTTAYTPYQPERSQGTLMSHWVYQSTIAALTGFEAVNASMYDRASTLFEALSTTTRISRRKNTCLIFESLYPGDIEVLETEAIETGMNLVRVPIDPLKGKVNGDDLKALLKEHASDCAGVAFPHMNHFGCLEDVDEIVDVIHEQGVLAVAVVDPLLLGKGGFKPPVEFGEKGADLFVAEGQGLAIGPNYGGPGLGVFGIRYNDEVKTHIRSTPGRYVGDAKDIHGRVCKVLVISTREQHIRRDKATSNICSNQAFIASLAGAALLERGDEGMAQIAHTSLGLARVAASKLSAIKGVELKFGETAFGHAFTLKLDRSIDNLIQEGLKQGLQIGVDVTGRCGLEEPLLYLSFHEGHSREDVDDLVSFFENIYSNADQGAELSPLPESHLRKEDPGIPKFSMADLKAWYEKLAQQNTSPDNVLYPLGSCTMKYNPYLNDWAASLPGFAECHPQVPESEAQGCLEILYESQEIFKKIFGMPAVTTEPLAGAQGELVGLKMFQAYHRDRGEKRDIVLLPRTAHGTNPATATMAGFETKNRRGEVSGVVLVEALENGEIDFAQLEKLVAEYGKRIAGIMITNPNTSGIFETNFKRIADLIHNVGGLVYMDGANMNAIAGWVNLGAMGVDAVHNNTHKTWSIPHGGGGPGDAVVGVSEKLIDYLPGVQVFKQDDGTYVSKKMPKSIGSFHRHFGNFGHKVRLYTYLLRLGREGVRRMSAYAVLSARYLYQRLSATIPVLPTGSKNSPRMHEFILTLPKEVFEKAEAVGIGKSDVVPRVGKLFLDYGFHAPTVAFPEVLGIMIEPTESYSKAELDRFADAVESILDLVKEHPSVLKTVPHFTPVDRVDDVEANRNLKFFEVMDQQLPLVEQDRIPLKNLWKLPIEELRANILKAHEKAVTA